MPCPRGLKDNWLKLPHPRWIQVLRLQHGELVDAIRGTAHAEQCEDVVVGLPTSLGVGSSVRLPKEGCDLGPLSRPLLGR